MIETVVALLLILNGNIIEHTFKDNFKFMSQIKTHSFRREVNPESVVFSCKIVKAKTEIYMGGKKILKILK